MSKESQQEPFVQARPSQRLKVVIGHPKIGFGGSESVLMWLIEALKQEFELTVLTTGDWNLEALNQYYGTHVQENDVRIRIAPMPALLKSCNSAALRGAYYQRCARAIGKEYDLCISAYNITDWGKPAIHYLADFTWHPQLRSQFGPPPLGFVHRNTLVRAAYLRVVNAIAGSFGTKLYPDDFLIANSHWTAEILEQHCNIKCSRVIYPPVWEHFPAVPWEQKERAFVIVGRIAIEKRVEQAIDILQAVRRNGHAIALHLCGEIENTAYGRKIARLCQAHSDWIVHEGLVQGAKKREILSHCRFGLHVCTAELFGIAVAEMASAGAIVFAPGSGGAVEIIDSPELLFDDADNAVEKICRVLSSIDSQASLRNHLQLLAGRFCAESFMREGVAVVHSFSKL